MFYLIAIFVLLSKSGLSMVDGANILGLMGMTSHSHHIWNSVLMHRLAEEGHNVTILSVDMPKPSEKIPSKVHYIYLEKAYAMFDKEMPGEKFDITAYIGLNPFKSIKFVYDYGIETCKGILASEGLQTLLNYPDDFKFDVVLYDYTLGPYLLGFLHKFNYPPLVGMTAFHNPPETADAMFNHYFPAYVPHHSTAYTAEMDFWQRFENTLIYMAETVYRRLIYLPQIDAIMRPYFAYDTPNLRDLAEHTAISLVNSHPSINNAESLPPNVIEVGGMQILDAKPLQKDLDEFMNKGQKGAVLISFGTNMKSEDFTEEQIRMVLSTISQLSEYNFMWKFDVKYLKGTLPQNVLIRSFLPQRDVLAHPKIKAFVTHCGGLSSQEATWRGVPMIGIPLFLDQHRNLRQSMSAGVAEKIDFKTMTAEILRDTIKRVAEDPKMAENVRRRSAQFQDQPMKPLDTAVWWVEYLLRNPNPYHLKSPAAKLNIFQANALDVILLLWTAFLLFVCLCIYLFVKLIRCWLAPNVNKNATEVKKKQ